MEAAAQWMGVFGGLGRLQTVSATTEDIAAYNALPDEEKMTQFLGLMQNMALSVDETHVHDALSQLSTELQVADLQRRTRVLVLLGVGNIRLGENERFQNVVNLLKEDDDPLTAAFLENMADAFVFRNNLILSAKLFAGAASAVAVACFVYSLTPSVSTVKGYVRGMKKYLANHVSIVVMKDKLGVQAKFHFP